MFYGARYLATISNTEHTGMFVDFPVGDLACLGYGPEDVYVYLGQKISETSVDLYSAMVF